ncbi:MAG: hypothetical protein C5B50_24790 [Verrucomicrobia bacterium]|nr:MAG: hypothetical protein C5B50_24790 [Verrucomicrobiota bacterium]
MRCRHKPTSNSFAPTPNAARKRRFARSSRGTPTWFIRRRGGRSNRDLARDVAQSVFTDLARKARPLAAKLTEASSLVGWLYRSTRFAALNQVREGSRRLARERQAMEQLITNSESEAGWERVRPLLDEAMADLSDNDREAVLLRYFKNHRNLQKRPRTTDRGPGDSPPRPCPVSGGGYG